MLYRRLCLADAFTRKEHHIHGSSQAASRRFSSISITSHLPPSPSIMSPSTAQKPVSFNLPNTKPPIPITIPAHLSSTITRKALLSFPAFKTWSTTLLSSLELQHEQKNHHFQSDPYTLRSISVDGATFFGHDPDPSKNRLGFLTLSADVSNDEGEKLPGMVFLRGGSVAILLVLEPVEPDAKAAAGSKSRSTSTSKKRARQAAPTDDEGDVGAKEEYVLLTSQPRVAAGSLSFLELPAGMLDDSGSFAGAAAKEIAEETGLDIKADELVDLTYLASRVAEATIRKPPSQKAPASSIEPHLERAIYPSPGGSDEFIAMLYARKRMAREEMEGLKGKLTGLREEGEKISLKVVRMEDVWKECFRDGKTLAALALYDALNREGKIR